MTALKPIENRKVRGVASEEYPLNTTCAHPDCTEKVTKTKAGKPHAHHVFPRSLTKSESYFVEITDDAPETPGEGNGKITVIPHATGLCGSGTTGHHGDVEEHRAWIKLEDGVYNYYERSCECRFKDSNECCDNEWTKIGPLNPQPGSVEGKAKRKGKKHGEPRANRSVWPVKVPQDAQENGADLLDEKEQLARDILVKMDAIVVDAPRYGVVSAALDSFNEENGWVLRRKKTQRRLLSDLLEVADAISAEMGEAVRKVADIMVAK